MTDMLWHPAMLPLSFGLLGSMLFVWRTYIRLHEGKRQLERQREEHRSLFQNNVDGVVAVDSEGAILMANPAACDLVGLGEDELVGRPFPDLIVEEGRSRANAALEAALGGIHSTLETEVQHLESELSEVELTSVPIVIGDDVVGAYEILRDSTERKRLERELEDRALHDYLTGLPNRALFSDRLAHALNRRRRDAESVALLYVDLDRFKPINDRAGHKVGDHLLCEVATRLKSLVRDADTVARIGGDEFAVLLETVDGEAQALAAAERIVAVVRAPIITGGEEHQVGASVGIAVSTEDLESPEELVHQADLAMYEAKRRGGFQFKLYSHELEQEGSGWADQIEGQLRRAVEKEELELVYQPIVDVGGSRIVGVEALVRWTHPEHGLLMPNAFIAVAEKSSLIAEIDRWVLEQSCNDIKRLLDFGVMDTPFCLSVNLSARHFDESDFVDAIEDIVRRTRFPSNLLQLEITESSAGGDPEKVRELKQLGVKVAIDDFGTGYSSLSYLKDLDVDVLKVDRSFVLALGADPASVAIVRTILTLAEMLNLEVIVEGIEDPVQLAHLEDLGGSLVQGFFFGRPVPATDLPNLLSNGIDVTKGRVHHDEKEEVGAVRGLPPLGASALSIIPKSHRKWKPGRRRP
ncbi:MAG: EAL domain-containing protein [Gemmatimonadota bacterium]|nr:EAL domain-containing protein [Gemmatimonadota bacterium]